MPSHIHSKYILCQCRQHDFTYDIVSNIACSNTVITTLLFLCRINNNLFRKPMNCISLKGTSNLEVRVWNMSTATLAACRGLTS